MFWLTTTQVNQELSNIPFTVWPCNTLSKNVSPHFLLNE